MNESAIYFIVFYAVGGPVVVCLAALLRFGGIHGHLWRYLVITTAALGAAVGVASSLAGSPLAVAVVGSLLTWGVSIATLRATLPAFIRRQDEFHSDRQKDE